jgi:O-antigen chain-terminating methyltransferase
LDLSDRLRRSEDESRRARAGIEGELRAVGAELRQSLARIGSEIAHLQAEKAPRWDGGAPVHSSRADANGLDAFYVAFEDRFRGTREMIRERMTVYLPLIGKANAGRADCPVLDLGCGRGEWLQLLREHGHAARGIDANAAMVRECRAQGLDVIEADALSYLRTLETGSIGAITGMHVIEHLPFDQLVALADESLRVLVAGGVVAFETPNPENLVVGACSFYADPTHQRPLPPEPIRFLFEARGFADVEIMRLHPSPEFRRTNGDSDEWRGRLNELLFGPQDYAVTGRKA